MNLSSIIDKLDNYTEVRVQENKTTLLALMNGNLIRNEETSTSGVSSRVFKNGYFGFASKSEVSDDAILKVIKSASDNAEFLSNRGGGKQKPYQSEKIEVTKDFSTSKDRWTKVETMDFLKSIDNYIKDKYPDLVSRTVVLNSIETEKHTVTSDGTSSYLLWPRTVLYMQLTTENNGEPCEIYEILGGRGHLEDNFTTVDALKDVIDELHGELMKKNIGVYPVAGQYDVILDANLAGILAHEALGHTVEADIVRNGSIAGDFLNKQVASPLISLIDFAHTYNGEILPVPVFVDDEGCEAKDAVIIKDGILKTFMHNRDSAFEFNTENTGNARAWQYSDEPLIRMRNTAIIPGTSKLEDMIASIKDGYYFTKTSNGEADTTGEFMFGVCAGYEIKDGKLGKAIKDTTISGKAFDVLASVTMVSDEMKWSAGGMCGKKQWIPTGMGGPAIKCRINVGGR